MSREDYFRKEEDEMESGRGRGADQEAIKTERKREIGEEGVNVGGGGGLQPWPWDVMNPGVNVSSVQDPQGTSVQPPPASDISHMLVNEPDTVSTSPPSHSPVLIMTLIKAA